MSENQRIGRTAFTATNNCSRLNLAKSCGTPSPESSGAGAIGGRVIAGGALGRPGLDGRAEGAERPAAVGGGVLGGGVHLGAGTVPAVGHEDRVVAEPVRPARRPDDPAVPGRLG